MDVLNLDSTLSELAFTRAGAGRVFQRRGLDYACQGGVGFRAACAERGLAPEAVAAEIDPAPPETDWRRVPLQQVIHYILERFHDGHRRDFARLARALGHLQAAHADVEIFRTLGQRLQELRDEFEPHMQREEELLFPLVQSKAAPRADGPLRVMVAEHRTVMRIIGRMTAARAGLEPPEGAGPSRTRLFTDLEALEHEMHEHTHLENNLLAPLTTAIRV